MHAGFPDPVCARRETTVPGWTAFGNPVTRTEFVGWPTIRRCLQPERCSAAPSAPGGGGHHRSLRPAFLRRHSLHAHFHLVTLPLVIGLGLGLALALDATARAIRGPIIFVSLLPFIITPVIGSLSIRWLFESDGILTDALGRCSAIRLSPLGQGWTLEC